MCQTLTIKGEKAITDEISRAGMLEAVLFAAGDPLTREELAELLDCEETEVETAARELESHLEGRGLMLRAENGHYQLVTRPETYGTVQRLRQVTDRRLTAPAMETLAVIAFKQPVTRQEIERIRGVRVERAVAKLLELGFIEEVGRKPVIGRPILYGTTAAFLRCFGVTSLDELRGRLQAEVSLENE